MGSQNFINGCITTSTWIHLSLRTANSTTFSQNWTNGASLPAHLPITIWQPVTFVPSHLMSNATRNVAELPWWWLPSTIRGASATPPQGIPSFVSFWVMCIYKYIFIYIYIYISYIHTTNIYIHTDPQSLKVALFIWPWWWGDYLPIEMDFSSPSSQLCL